MKNKHFSNHASRQRHRERPESSTPRRGKGGHHSRGRLFGPGEMRLAMLDLLGSGPAHGYELMQRLSDKTEGRYEPSAGAIYPVLQQLVDEGLADVHADGGRKVYRLTADGQSVRAAGAQDLAGIWHRAATWRQWSRLDSAEVSDVGELRTLVRTVLDRVRDNGSSEDSKAEIKLILSEAIERIRGL